MRTTTLVVLGVALLSATGCGGGLQCYAASATCTVTCDAVPGEVFTGGILKRAYWSSGDPTAIPAYTLEQPCRNNNPAPKEAASCFAKTPWEERNQAITCTCTPWTVTDDDAECPSSNWVWK